MIPLRLTVKNFMCYRDDVPTLELEGIHVACVCGDNGHGKTALLDAITWVLWGEARARTQEELVHQGQRDMAVELEFLARGQRYRVSRRHSRSARSRQGSTMLELQLADNGAQPITGDSVRDTEARIRDLLHMDYDTFVSTAFLRQGDADRFTKSTPAKRKEHLAEVLDLSYYEALERRARERSRALQHDIRDAEGAIALRQQELARRPEHEARLTEVEATLARMTPEAETQRLKMEELRLAVASLRSRGRELEELVGRLDDGRRDLGGLEDQLQGHESRVAEYEAALEMETEVGERFAELEQSRVQLERLNQALALKSVLDAQRAELERSVAVQRERLSAQVTQLRTRAHDLEERSKRLSGAESGLVAVAGEQAELTQVEDTLRQQRGKVQEASAALRYLEETKAALVREMEATRKKFDMLEDGDTVCPLCNQPLGREGQDHLRREYEAQGLQSKQRYGENTAEQEALNRSHQDIAADVSKLESDLGQRRRQVESRLAVLERERAEATEAGDSLQSALAELEAAEARLDRNEFAHGERARLAKLEVETSALDYDAEGHRAARDKVESLRHYDQLHAKLDAAKANLSYEREALETTREMLRRRREGIEEGERRKALLEGELAALPGQESQLVDAEVRHRELEKRANEALADQRYLRSQIERYDTLEAEVREQQEERARLSDEKGLYDELAVAFGRNGIQALIIETAIPQLEADANELLARLTENRMSLRLQLVEGRRDRSTGLPAEELDIKIADEVGTRSYETFSGGEAFRVDFALRIAMSKLLARRSGAPLPILFIDEGFGSQDAAGQERLTEAIQSIADDFQKILVITHVEQIKEAFPVRIEVTKTGSGSTFVVV